VATLAFTHLHLHSDVSILDSTITIKKLIERCQEVGMTSVAVTDHGLAGNAIKLYKEAKSVGIKPVIGMEAYLSPTDDHTLREKVEGYPNYYHLTLLAKNQEGVKQIFQLSTLGFTEGFYHKPRISLLQLEALGRDLIVLGGCVRGPISWHLVVKDPKGEDKGASFYNESLAYEFAVRLKNSFTGRFFIELMDHGLPWQPPLNEKLLDLSSSLSIPCVPTNDCHFPREEDHAAHSVMTAIQLRKTLPELLEADMVYPKACYIKSEGEMRDIFPQEDLDRTSEVVEMIDISLNLGVSIFPKF